MYSMFSLLIQWLNFSLIVNRAAETAPLAYIWTFSIELLVCVFSISPFILTKNSVSWHC